LSTQRFAPLTSNLFARKGDAAPSAPKPSLYWARQPAPPRPDIPPPPPPQADRPHRMMIALSSSDYEKLGIAAVKKGLTRHQILRSALDAHLDRLKREYGGCGCMAMGGPCREGCGAV
jgi:hypothetical protein